MVSVLNVIMARNFSKSHDATHRNITGNIPSCRMTDEQVDMFLFNFIWRKIRRDMFSLYVCMKTLNLQTLILAFSRLKWSFNSATKELWSR